jgi:glycosyltransferase involved in cell wall biosynthesis
MTTNPLISVLVPAYNGEAYLRESIASILGQTYTNLEVIVLDDASTDGTAAIVEEFDDERLRYHRNERNLGQFGNLNVGLSLAQGDLIAIQHDDDVFLSEILEKECRVLMQQEDVGAVFSLDLFIGPDGEEIGRVKPPPELVGKTLDFTAVLTGVLRYMNVFIRGGTSLVRRNVYEDVGPFSSQYGLRGDIHMWLRIARHSPIAILDEYLTCYRWGHDHLSGSYGYLRTEPELHFSVMDERLANGERKLVDASVLRDYEAHRAEDLLMVTTARYVLDRREAARESLNRASPLAILSSRQVQRWRLLTLFAALTVLTRLPRSGAVADFFRARWHSGGGAQAKPATSA